MSTSVFFAGVLGWGLAFLLLRHVLLWMFDYVTWPELHWTGAFRKRQWKYLGFCLDWRAFDGNDMTVTGYDGVCVVHRGHRDCVLGVYPLNWRFQLPMDGDHFYGWAFGPIAYSYSTF